MSLQFILLGVNPFAAKYISYHIDVAEPSFIDLQLNFGNTSYRCNAAVTSLITNLCTVLNYTEHYRKELYYLARTNYDCTTAKCICNCNTSVSDHEEGAMGFVQRKRLPRSPANSSVRYIDDVLSVRYNILTYSYKTDPRTQHESPPRRHKIHCGLK